MAHHRRHAKTHKSSHGSRIFLIALVLLLGLIVWWGVSGILNFRRTVNHFSATGSHAFITSDSDNPVILLAQQGTAQQLQSLAVVRLDYSKHSINTVQLPVDLSDGQTTAAEYLESGYYKELQQMVEQVIALPINHYIIQPRSTQTNPDQVAWPSIFERQTQLGWWTTTLGAPSYFEKQPKVMTSLSAWQFTQAIWLSRDVDDQKVSTQVAPDSAFSRTLNDKLVSDATVVDPIIEEYLVDQEAKSEGVSVVVKNATDTSGLASLAARYVHHLGGEVVAVEAADSSQVNSSMVGEKSSRLSQDITSLLGVTLTTKPRTGRERSDIELIVGVDMLNRLGRPAAE